MKSSLTAFFVTLLAFGFSIFCQGKDITGMSRDQIVEGFGEPQSALESSNREILNYPQGQIIISQGKVSSYKGSFSIAGNSSETPPKEAAPVIEKPVAEIETAPDMSRRSIQPFWWSHTLAGAQARSEKEGRPILALFTGPDWCAPCQQLEAEVLNTGEFKRLGRKKYIPLKVALYKNTYQDMKAKKEYQRLSDEYGIEAVPSFVILTSDGEVIRKPDIFKQRNGVSSFSEQVFAAISEVEASPGGMSLTMQIGAGLVLGGLLFVFFRR